MVKGTADPQRAGPVTLDGGRLVLVPLLGLEEQTRSRLGSDRGRHPREQVSGHYLPARALGVLDDDAPPDAGFHETLGAEDLHCPLDRADRHAEFL